MPLQLRDYQASAVQAIKAALSSKNTALLVAPCAAGKTVVFSEIVAWLRHHNRKCLILLDRENLVSQTAARIAEYIGNSDDVGIACATASSKKETDKPVVVASRQTLAPMLKNGSKGIKFNIAILDEVHLCHPKRGQYHDILEQLIENYPAMRIMGCTATPYRLAGGKIYGDGKMFSGLDYQITTKKLLDDGFLVPLTWKVKQSDLNRMLDRVKRSSTGDLNETEQAAILNQERHVQGVYDVWEEHANGRKTVVFALNIEHAELIRDVFDSKGIQTWIVHSKMPNAEVKSCISEFETGSGVMINVGILTVGSDIPSISCIILARRTLSTALFFQIVGRGARLHPGKENCLILDLCGNALIHGIDPDNPIRNETPDRESQGQQKVKICPICEEALGMTAKICPSCGFEFPVSEKDPDDESSESKDVKLVDFKGFTVLPDAFVACEEYRAKGKKIPTVLCKYRNKEGSLIAQQWLCPEHPGFPSQKAGRYWILMGGRWPTPKTVAEWIRRYGELHFGRVNLTVDPNGPGGWPVVKKVTRCL